jgi:hypothetical protein
MNFAGVTLMSDTRHRTKRSRGLVFLALAIRTPRVPPGHLDGSAENAADPNLMRRVR